MRNIYSLTLWIVCWSSVQFFFFLKKYFLCYNSQQLESFCVCMCVHVCMHRTKEHYQLEKEKDGHWFWNLALKGMHNDMRKIK